MIRLAVLTVVALLFTGSAQSRPMDVCDGLAQVRVQAIRDSELGRDIHREWIDYIEAGLATPEQVRIGGTVEWHQLWVDRYDVILAALNNSRPVCP